MNRASKADEPIARAREALRARGMRWTPQRRALIEVLVGSHGHMTGIELIELARQHDPDTTPSTVYRTLNVLEELGLVRHSHGHDGREEFHVLPSSEHAHLTCESCGGSWEVEGPEATDIVGSLERTRGFRVHLSHLTIAGQCADCAAKAVTAES